MSVAAKLSKLEREYDRWGESASRFTPAPYPRDIAAYAIVRLNITPTPGQCAIWAACLNPPYRALVPSANAQGKTMCGAVMASHTYDHFKPSTTLITAPVRQQVIDGIFKELRTLRGPKGFLPKESRLQSSHDHYVHGYTAATPDGFQGRHAEHFTLLFDEATSIDLEFWNRGRTMWKGTPGHKWACFYNPNDPSSPAAAEEDTGIWPIVRLNGLEHPNISAQLRGDAPPIPSAFRLEQLLARITAECQETDDPNPVTDFEFPAEYSPIYGPPKWYRPIKPAFESQVLGRWPLLPTEGLFTPTMVEQMFSNYLQVDPSYAVVIGCDVARFGTDMTAIIVRRGPCVLHAETHSKRDTIWIADRCVQLAAQYDPQHKSHNAYLNVDATGGYGGGVIDNVRGRINTTDVNMASKSPDPTILRMRSFLWFRLVSLYQANLIDLSRISGTIATTLKSELIAPRYRHSDGPRVVESKAQIKSRLGRSPDLADALGLAFMEV